MRWQPRADRINVRSLAAISILDQKRRLRHCESVSHIRELVRKRVHRGVGLTRGLSSVELLRQVPSSDTGRSNKGRSRSGRSDAEALRAAPSRPVIAGFIMMSDMARLIEPLIPALRRYARVLLKDRAAADDLVQDCLERVISRWHQRRADGDTRSWIFTILHNLAMTRLSRRTNRPQHIAIEDAEESVLSVPPSQEDRLRYRDLLGALSQLPEEQRAVLLLVSVEDLSYAETANVLDVPVGTVMSRLSRARERLLKATSGQVQTSSSTSPIHLRTVK